MDETGLYGRPLPCMSGRDKRDKRYSRGIRAALQANERIIVAGTTEENGEYFQRKIRPLVDDDRVEFIGSVNFEQKQRFLADAKAVLMPIQWDDPFPTVALESLASGTPVIAWNRSSMVKSSRMARQASLSLLSGRWRRELGILTRSAEEPADLVPSVFSTRN